MSRIIGLATARVRQIGRAVGSFARGTVHDGRELAKTGLRRLGLMREHVPEPPLFGTADYESLLSILNEPVSPAEQGQLLREKLDQGGCNQNIDLVLRNLSIRVMGKNPYDAYSNSLARREDATYDGAVEFVKRRIGKMIDGRDGVDCLDPTPRNIQESVVSAESASSSEVAGSNSHTDLIKRAVIEHG